MSPIETLSPSDTDAVQHLSYLNTLPVTQNVSPNLPNAKFLS